MRSSPIGELCDIPVIMLTIVDDRNRGIQPGRRRLRHQAGGPPPPVADPRKIRLPELVVARFSWSTTMPRPPEVTRTILEKEGWKVSEAKNGRAALECMERERPSLIVLDLMMPEMDGFEFAARGAQARRVALDSYRRIDRP